jgi:uncharacterized peroxidase-related enzyme
MSRILPIDPTLAPKKSQELLAVVEKKLGIVPNMMKTMAHSPAVLDAYLSFSNALGASKLSAKVREQIALTVAEVNSCAYCLSAHSFIGGKLGLNQAEVDAARHAASSDPKTAAILGFARDLVIRRGEVRDQELRNVRAAGVSDGEIGEIVATVALNVFTNWFNHVSDPVIDFPEVRPGTAPAHSESTCSSGACSS